MGQLFPKHSTELSTNFKNKKKIKIKKKLPQKKEEAFFFERKLEAHLGKNDSKTTTSRWPGPGSRALVYVTPIRRV